MAGDENLVTGTCRGGGSCESNTESFVQLTTSEIGRPDTHFARLLRLTTSDLRFPVQRCPVNGLACEFPYEGEPLKESVLGGAWARPG